jgi:hypothetical protein
MMDVWDGYIQRRASGMNISPLSIYAVDVIYSLYRLFKIASRLGYVEL